VLIDICLSRSRSWVEEEGEVFRKGTALLGPEEMDGEYAGEDLRKEVCVSLMMAARC
jgi:protein phosphatase 1 regulatory subunit 37